MRFVLASLVAVQLIGCASVDPGRQVRSQAADPMVGQPAQRPVRTITSMTPALRCMQDKLVLYRVAPVTFGLGDIRDETRSMNVGARDMFATAFGQMRTREVRVNLLLPPASAIGGNGQNPTIIINNPAPVSGRTASGEPVQLEQRGTFDRATYLITGSITAVDREVVAGQTDGAARTGNSGVGASSSSKAKLLSVDLQLADRATNLQLPGSAISNSITIVEDSTGLDSTLGFDKFGVSFSTVAKRNESDGKALRTLFELGAIEAVGRALKVPYWNCISGNELDAASQREISTIQDDWLAQLSSQGHPRFNDVEAWLVRVLDARGYLFLGGMPDPDKLTELDQIFLRSARRQALADIGLDPRADSDRTAFTVLVKADTGPMAPLTLWGLKLEHRLNYRHGESIEFKVHAEQDGHLSCYLQDSDRRVMRIFPNPYTQDGRIDKTKPLLLPGDAGLRLRAAATPGKPPAELLCVNSTVELDRMAVFNDLAPSLQPLPVADLGALAKRFNAQASAVGLLGAYRFHVLVEGH